MSISIRRWVRWLRKKAGLQTGCMPNRKGNITATISALKVPISIIRSVCCSLSKGETDNYWFSTGTTKMLVDLVIRNNISLPDLDGEKCSKEDLCDITYFGIDPVPLLYQSDYLTI